MLIRGLAPQVRENDILKLFGEQYGAVVALELPQKKIGDTREFEREEREAKEREAEFKRAQIAV